MKLKDRLNPRYTRISLYIIGTCVIIYILGYIVNNIPSVAKAVGTFFSYLWRMLTPVFWGFILAYLLMPVNTMFEKFLFRVHLFRRSKKHARACAVALTAVLAIVVITILLSLIVSTFTRQLSLVSPEGIADLINQATRSVNSFYNQTMDWLENLNLESSDVESYLQDIGTAAADMIRDGASSLLVSVRKIPSFFSSTIFTIIFAVYFQLDHEGLKRYWSRVFHALFSPRFNKVFRIFISDADRVCSGYIRGQFLDAFLMCIEFSVGLSLVGVRFSVIIGVLAGIGNLIPYVGPFVAYVSVIVVCLITGDLQTMIIGLIVAFILQTIDGNVVNPKLLSSNIDIHPMLVIIALIFGSSVGGIVGMLAAVPIMALLKIQFERLVDYMISRRGLAEAVPEEGKEETDEPPADHGRTA